MRKLIIAFMFIIFAISITFNSTTYATELNITPQISKIENGKDRKAYATELYTFFSKIDEYLPSLSPSQRDWLEKEWKACRKNRNSQRYTEITNSKEYMIDYVKIIHIQILSHLVFINLIKNASEQKKELYLWTAITVDLLDTEYWQNLYHLIEKGLVDKNYFYLGSLSDRELFFINNGEIPAQKILMYIVKPYFAGNLPN